jgi:hypothetical protein
MNGGEQNKHYTAGACAVTPGAMAARVHADMFITAAQPALGVLLIYLGTVMATLLCWKLLHSHEFDFTARG